ncbi:MAG TPA: Rieske 2Fe-2S domain-containing protein [Chloroflexota bacterium]|nr:Rieske 2Fe-2S domain-containing protein [Chloroflexota bacterium]
MIDPEPGRRTWRREFPYHWNADEAISRRELLNFAVYASGALFAATAVIAGIGFLRRANRAAPKAVARADDVPQGQAVYFHYPTDALGDEAMMLHLPNGQFVAYNQTCTHLSCGVFYQPDQQRLFCPCHEGVFNPDTGEPTAGPPQRRLTRITLQQQNGVLYATGWEQ